MSNLAVQTAYFGDFLESSDLFSSLSKSLLSLMLRPECVIVLILQATFRKSAVQSKKQFFYLVNSSQEKQSRHLNIIKSSTWFGDFSELRGGSLTWILSAEGCVERGGKAWSAISSSGSKTYNKHEAAVNHYVPTTYLLQACSCCIGGILGNWVKPWDKSWLPVRQSLFGQQFVKKWKTIGNDAFVLVQL